MNARAARSKKAERRALAHSQASERLKRAWQNPEYRARQCEMNRRFLQKRWQDPVYRTKALEWTLRAFRSWHQQPNKSELKLLAILQELGYPYEYTGDGSFVVAGHVPDFRHPNKPYLIELFGEFFHRIEEVSILSGAYSSAGYRTLIVWAKELKQPEMLKMKIMAFEENRIEGKVAP